MASNDVKCTRHTKWLWSVADLLEGNALEKIRVCGPTACQTQSLCRTNRDIYGMNQSQASIFVHVSISLCSIEILVPRLDDARNWFFFPEFVDFSGQLRRQQIQKYPSFGALSARVAIRLDKQATAASIVFSLSLAGESLSVRVEEGKGHHWEEETIRRMLFQQSFESVFVNVFPTFIADCHRNEIRSPSAAAVDIYLSMKPNRICHYLWP